MKTLLKTLVLLATLVSLGAIAQQAQDFGEYSVHYNALNSSLITPEGESKPFTLKFRQQFYTE